MTELIRRLDPTRFRVHVACFHRDGAWLPRVEERAASVVEFPIRGFARTSTVRQLMAFTRWCRRERIAVVQTCDLYANTFGLPGAALAGVPMRIGSRRELNPDKSAWQILAQRHAYRSATKVVANSAAAAAALVQEGLAPESIAVIPNGIDLAASVPRDRIPGIRTIVTVANLRPEKCHATLLAAAATLVRRHPDLRFLIVGDGPERRTLEALVDERGLSGHVQFLGHREDVPALLASADAFVLPSRSEAFPNAVVEAMAAGLPVVATAIGGVPELIEHDRTGLLVRVGDPDHLAAALTRLVERPEHAALLGREARHVVLQRYSFDRMVSSFEDLYLRGLLAHGSALVQTAQPAGI
jgi:glycosyltransferase involved in cell wall biosynthesis